MTNQAFAIALRIVTFKAGPQDFPYAAGASRAIVPFTALTWFLQYRLTLQPAQAMVQTFASLAVLAAFSFWVLQRRALLNRLRQTVDSLFLTDAMLTLLLLPPLAAIAPQMIKLAANPDLARAEPLPALPALAVMVVSMWNFMVTAHIYRNALGTSFGGGALMALLSTVVTVSVASVISGLMA